MHICTDSKAALQALSRVCINSQVVLLCARTLNRLGGLCQLHLNWVPGHIGVSGNVAADRLAILGQVSDIKASFPVHPEKSLRNLWQMEVEEC